jgi:putative hydrolase of the HAD superfamily
VILLISDQHAAIGGRSSTCPDWWVFDLDNTLHPAENGLQASISARITRFVADFLGLEPAAALIKQKQMFRDHGTTLRGLMNDHGVVPDLFFDYINGVDYDVVAPNSRLAAVLARLPGQKLVFTNASARHAEQVIERLGIASHIDGVFDAEAAAYRAKPDPAAYTMLVDRFGVAPQRAVMVEDLARNLAPAAALGMTTVWLRALDQPDPHLAAPDADADYVHHETDDLLAWLETFAVD